MERQSAKPLADFQCTSCGKCCLEGASQLPVIESDIALWEAEAPHILEFVKMSGEPGQRTGFHGEKFTSQKKTTRCKWIKKYPNRDAYYCRIYEYRPQVCRDYPISFEHADFTGCPGFLENSPKSP